MLKLFRRKKYKYKIYNGDYFVVKHISSFTKDSLSKYLKKDLIVGDLGCGEQPWRKHIESLGAHYFGIDITQNSQNSIDLIAPITSVPLSDNYFDLILCTEVLEHVSDNIDAFKELSRLIKSNGKIIITVPFIYPLHEEPFDFIRVTPYHIKQVAAALNLEIIELTKSGNELEVLATIWDNTWSRMSIGHSNALSKIFSAMMRLPANILAFIGSFLFNSFLPNKACLNVMCILTKR